MKPRFAVDEHLCNLFDASDDETTEGPTRHGDGKPSDEDQPAQEVEPLQLRVNSSFGSTRLRIWPGGTPAGTTGLPRAESKSGTCSMAATVGSLTFR
jgi:hypothetical protein